jgi:predicted dehydrogenase
VKSKIRCAILGCGKIAKKHAEAILAVEKAHLVAGVETNNRIAKDFAQCYEVPCYEDIERLFSNEDIDVVIIATPSGTHYTQCMEVIQYGKDIIVEKPITLRLDDADNLLKESINAGVNIIEVKQYRFHPAVQKLHEAIETGRIGKIIYAAGRTFWCRPEHYYKSADWRGTWAADGGVFMNQAIHHVDLLQWLVGPVESVYAQGRTMLSDIEAEDCGCAFLKFASGALGVVEATTCARPVDVESSMSILGEKGSVVIGGYATNQIIVWNFQEEYDEDDETIRLLSQPTMAKDKSGHRRMYREIVNYLFHDKDYSEHSYLVNASKARMCVELMNAIYESIETDHEIQLRFRPQKSKLGRNNL